MTRREQLERAVEQAIALLDALDGDPDREPDSDDEPDGSDEHEWHWPTWYGRA